MESINSLHPNSLVSAVAGVSGADSRVKKPFAWHLSRALSRQLYTTFVAAGVLLALYPRAYAPQNNEGHVFKCHWLGLSLLVFFEVLIVDFVCKRHLRLPRPSQPHRNGFPSGHSTFSFGLATMLAVLYPLLSPLFFVLAGAVSWSRFYLKAHYLYQVCGGAFIGILLGWVMGHVR